MIKLKSEKEIQDLREGGRRLAAILEKVAEVVRPGITTKELDVYAEKLIRDQGDHPAFLNYAPEGARFPYPASLCVSVNEEVVHGIPSGARLLEEGDIVTIDLGLKHKNLFTDHAITVGVGKISEEDEKFLEVTKESLNKAIEAAQPGNTIGDIGYAVESYVKPFGYGIIRILSGHGVGYSVHEDPFVPNFGKSGTGEKLVPGMVIAIEPMLTKGSHKVHLEKDGYTFKTNDGSRAAHFEHTIAITKDGPLVLTEK